MRKMQKKTKFVFEEHEMKLDWIADKELRLRTRQRIDHNGVFTQAQIVSSDTFGGDAVIKLNIKTYKTKTRNEVKNEAKSAGSMFKQFAIGDSAEEEEEYTLHFEPN